MASPTETLAARKIQRAWRMYQWKLDMPLSQRLLCAELKRTRVLEPPRILLCRLRDDTPCKCGIRKGRPEWGTRRDVEECFITWSEWRLPDGYKFVVRREFLKLPITRL